MIDDMVALLGKEQKDDDTQKEFCRDEFDRTADEEVAAKEKVAAITASIEESTDELAQVTEEIATLKQEIKDIDKAVAQATEQRKEEHEESVTAAQMSQAALQLVDKAKSRLAKFYNPAFVQETPPQAGSLFSSNFVQIKSHSRAKDFMDESDDQPEAPETFSGEVKKNEKSAGVIGMMDQIMRDLENDMKDAEYEEKTAQDDYAKLMGESEATRQQDVKSIADKEATKADLEAKLVTDKETATSHAEELANVQTAISDLHGTCDFIVQNYDLRKEARTNEIDALKNAKAMLSGAVM
jgi:chromosome segregation ATPase